MAAMTARRVPPQVFARPESGPARAGSDSAIVMMDCEARGSDRRNETRAEVAIWVRERTNDALYFQRASNLSLGGVFLEGTLPHPPGTRVALDLDLPDAPIRLEGEVVGHGPGNVGMAVRFVDLASAERSRLEAYLVAR